MLHKIKSIGMAFKFPLTGLNNIVKLGNYNSVRTLVKVIENEKKGIATVLLQKPPVNSLSLEMLQRLPAVIKELEEKKFKGFILASDSPKVFCAGLDIHELHNPSKERLSLFWESFQIMWKTLFFTPLITIAAVNGHAPAGGCVISLSCDHRIMVKSGGLIGLNETLLGFPAPKWVQLLLIHTCGYRKAESCLKLSKLCTPEEALKLGIVNELVDSPADLLVKAEEEMDKWLKIPNAAFQKTKLSMRKPFVDDLISYEKQDVEDVANIFLQDEVQNIIGKYLANLKGKK